jgi:hypothetical protein
VQFCERLVGTEAGNVVANNAVVIRFYCCSCSAGMCEFRRLGGFPLGGVLRGALLVFHSNQKSTFPRLAGS